MGRVRIITHNLFFRPWWSLTTKHAPSRCDWPRTYRLRDETPRGQVMGLRILGIPSWRDERVLIHIVEIIDYWINSTERINLYVLSQLTYCSWYWCCYTFYICIKRSLLLTQCEDYVTWCENHVTSLNIVKLWWLTRVLTHPTAFPKTGDNAELKALLSYHEKGKVYNFSLKVYVAYF